jgi:iron(III) transport system substrate-binding protein
LAALRSKEKTARFGPRRREDMMRRFDATRSSLIHALLVATAIGAAATMAAAQSAKQTVTVYTSLQKELLAPYEAAFRKAHPDIQIAWVREATGILHARLLAERENPRADVVFGVPVMNIIAFDKLGMIEPYAPKDYEQLKPRFRDPRKPPAWTGIDMWVNVICFNTVEAKKRNLPRPARWADLANPVYKGQIALPSPAASQTGYLNISGWIQMMGEDAAWKYMDAMHENVAVYTNSSSTPCKYAATGEYALGVSTDITAPLLKTKGAPIDIIVPEDKSPWEMEATALMKGARNPEAAKALIDWSVTRAANEQYNKFMAIVAMPGVANIPPNYPPDSEAKMADTDVAWAVDNRTRLISEWAKRYDAKSEPKGN